MKFEEPSPTYSNTQAARFSGTPMAIVIAEYSDSYKNVTELENASR